MNTAAAIARYQARELAIRWRSQPASPLARWFLTFALSAAAGVLLLGFAAAETARRAELRRLGLDTIVIQAPAKSLLQENESLPPDHWAAPLASQGDLLLLQQLPEPAYTPWGDPLPVFVSTQAFKVDAPSPPRPKAIPQSGSAPIGRGGLGASTFTIANDAIWYTRTLPPNRQIRLTRRNLPITVLTAAPAENMQALGLDDAVVLPPSAADERDAAGRLDVVLFRPNTRNVLFQPSARKVDAPSPPRPAATPQSGSAPIERGGLGASTFPTAIRRLFAAEGAPPPSIRDPAPYRAALDLFTRSQDRWRAGMATLLSLCVLLAFASIGMLEEKQTRYTQALLRSLGVSGAALWSVSLLENLILANTALLAALVASRFAARIVLELAGSPNPVPVTISPSALLWLACAVNSGVLLSLMPLAKALRRPIGTVLP